MKEKLIMICFHEHFLVLTLLKHCFLTGQGAD
jgi:hypothetical protein